MRQRRTKAVIDLGSSKLSCWLANYDDDQKVSVIGTSCVAMQGLWGGQLTNLPALAESLTKALYEIERETNIQVRTALVTLGGALFSSSHSYPKIKVENRAVDQRTITQLFDQVQPTEDDYPVHLLPLEFNLDQQSAIIDPRGMVGKELSAPCHVLWMNTGRLKTLMNCFKQCQIRVSDVVFSGYTSALACLSLDERQLGSILIDVGASSTTLSFFLHGRLVSVVTLPLGGHHITKDIAQGCQISLAHSERIKILYGAALMTPHDHHESIALPSQDEEELCIQRSSLITIIQARCEELILAIKDVLDQSPYRWACQRIVFSGGASKLPGLKELIHRLLDRPIRIAKPLTLHQAPKVSGEFASVVGAFLYDGMPGTTLLSQKKVFQPSWFSWLKKKAGYNG